ncbi:MAG: biopolymer transporter TolR, partial [Spirosoma sp.]|nr:biopolymer transporter TolR [Spirosoma sp.]
MNMNINRKILVVLVCVALTITLSRPSWSQSKGVGVFDGQSDVGQVLHAGAGTYNAARQEYTLSGSGTNIWAASDEFHFLWKRMKGDFIVYTRGTLVGKGIDPHRKIGWMARTSLEGNSPQVSAAVHGDGLTSLQYRRTTGATTEENRSALTGADVIQLERRGTTFTLRVAKFGEPFQVRDVTDIDLGDEVYVGLFVCSHNKDVVEKGVFQDVRISIPAKANAAPGKMDLGSRLELMDIATGKRDVIFTAPNSIQAPNWTRNGKTLIYNSEGLMYLFDL